MVVPSVWGWVLPRVLNSITYEKEKNNINANQGGRRVTVFS